MIPFFLHRFGRGKKLNATLKLINDLEKNASFVSLHVEQVPKLGTIRILLRSSIVDSTLIMARVREAILAANIAAMMLTDALVSVEWIVNLAILWFKERPVKCLKYLSLSQD